MKKIFLAMLSLLALMLVGAVSAGDDPAPAEPQEPPQTAPVTTPEAAGTPESPTATQRGAAAMVVTKDPVTGRLRPATAEETAQVLTEDTRKALSTSHEGLVEVASPVPGGGVMIDLKGRFFSVMTATVDAQGRVSTDCTTDPGTTDPTNPAPEKE